MSWILVIVVLSSYSPTSVATQNIGFHNHEACEMALKKIEERWEHSGTEVQGICVQNPNQ